MLKPYQNPKYVPLKGLLLLLLGSTLAGIAVGALAHLISNIFYFFFIFALLTGFAGLIIYDILLKISKVHHKLTTTLLAFWMGIWIAAAYFGTPYLIVRNDYIQDVQKEYRVDARTASDSLNSFFKDETGSSGFWGFMKWRAREGDEFTNYIGFNSIPIFQFGFTVKSTGAWLYWLVETLLFSLPIALMGLEAGKRPFNINANDWYDTYQNQIGSVPLHESGVLLSYIKNNDLDEIYELILPEEALSHPTIEIYEQHTKNPNGDFLLTVKQTNNEHKPNIKRKVLGQWELNSKAYNRFAELVKQKFEMLEDSAA